jgi:PAS domain S-box-containing protein
MRNRALSWAIVIGAFGIIIVGLVAYIQQQILTTTQETVPFHSLLNTSRDQVTTAHLWLEELIGGDGSLSFDRDVQGPLVAAGSTLQQLYDENHAQLDGASILDEDGLALLKQAIYDVEKIGVLADERWKTKIETTIPATDSTSAIVQSHAGDQLDQRFDAAVGNYLSLIARIEDHFGEITDAQILRLTLFLWFAIVVLVLAFVLGAYKIYTLLYTNTKLVDDHNARMEQQMSGVTSLSSFIESISAGNYTVDLELNNDEANLRGTLISMRDKLRLNAEDDRKRNWATSGLAQIGEILRVSGAGTEALYDRIIKFVVTYTKSNQGGIFVLNDENEGDPALDLVACYAFERKKFLKKSISVGEGLVGQCYLEGERIYLLEVPQEYVTITSGLGGAAPNALLLVPMKVNEKVFGVLELATFGKYEDHEIELVEKLTESIASTISAVRISESTRILLEKTQQQAEEMRAQEEEMRQNMEELEATQEEMRRKEKHIQNMLDNEKQRNEVSHKNRQILMEMTKTKAIQEGDWELSIEKITSTISKQLGISRCSIWEYRQRENVILCEKLYDASNGSFAAGTELTGRDFPGYFEAVSREEVIVAKDAHTHPATKEFSAGYLTDLGIQSMLDVPFFSEAKIAGIICCEHQREQKDWTDEDVEFLKSCADLVTVARNTAKINKMLDQLSDDQETMQTIIDNIPRAVFWKDKELRFQGCNRIFADVAGLKSPRDLVGKTDYEMPWKEHGDAYREDDQQVMNSRKARLDLEERNVNSEGVESWVLTSKVPVLNKHGEVVAVLGMFEDITARKLKEAEVEANMKELEELRKLVKKRVN